MIGGNSKLIKLLPMILFIFHSLTQSICNFHVLESNIMVTLLGNTLQTLLHLFVKFSVVFLEHGVGKVT